MDLSDEVNYDGRGQKQRISPVVQEMERVTSCKSFCNLNSVEREVCPTLTLYNVCYNMRLRYWVEAVVSPYPRHRVPAFKENHES